MPDFIRIFNGMVLCPKSGEYTLPEASCFSLMSCRYFMEKETDEKGHLVGVWCRFFDEFKENLRGGK